ncbi:MAG TPA: DUF4870 domain-containing protein [Patescibacteria group bacterium]|nr:DUF4870 domain-containing protein [Patescibacteria group bacterium]
MTVYDGNRNLVAALSYFLGFITGIVILLVEKDDKFIRFHAMQSSLVFGAIFVIDIILGAVIGAIPLLEFASSLFNTLVFIIALIVWIVSMLKAFQGQIYKWPIVGKIAEQQVGK